MRIPRTTSRIGTVATALVPAVLAGLMLLSAPAVALPGQVAPSTPDAGAPVAWARQMAAPAPQSRSHAAMAFDPATSSFVLFGGNSGSQVLADTWTWDGGAWSALTPAVSPPPLESASMVYDNGSHKLLLFGGNGQDGQATNGTWSWDGTTWLALNPATAPTPRFGASVAPEAANGTVLLFGGMSSPNLPLGDTWTWTGATWVAATPATSPPARGMAAITFDAARGVDVLFGGTGATTIGDTWTWDGAAWTRHNTPTVPWPRADATMAYDPVTQRSILFGGIGPLLPFGDTWLWDGTTWSLSALGVFGPPARSGASLAGSPGSQRLLLFGGVADNKTLGDTWTFAATGVTATPPPVTGGTVSTAPSTTVHGTATSGPAAVKPPGSPKASPGVTPTTASGSPVRNPPLDVTAHTIHRGGVVTLRGGGFAPNAIIDISLHSSTTFRTQVTTDSNGNFEKTVEVPASVTTGAHQIEARGPAMGGGRALILVASIRVTGTGARHGWLLPASMMGLTILIAGAAALVLTASARWPRRPSTPSGG